MTISLHLVIKTEKQFGMQLLRRFVAKDPAEGRRPSTHALAEFAISEVFAAVLLWVYDSEF